jgi:tripeptidyl-peptidase I
MSMMRLNVLFCLLAFMAGLDAIAIPVHHEVHEKRETLSPRWTKLDRVESHKLLPMRIGLTQTNIENGYEHLMKV